MRNVKSIDKKRLFKTLKAKGIFWSYSKDVRIEDVGDKILIEHLIKYGDFDDIKAGMKIFGHEFMKKAWMERVAGDTRFIRTNLMIARLFFGMNVESEDFKKGNHGRAKKLRLLASKDKGSVVGVDSKL